MEFSAQRPDFAAAVSLHVMWKSWRDLMSNFVDYAKGCYRCPPWVNMHEIAALPDLWADWRRRILR